MRASAEMSGETTYAACPICDSTIRPWRTKQGGNRDYRIDACGGCGYAFVNPRPSLAFLADFYSSFGHGQDPSSMAQAPTLGSVVRQEEDEPNSTLDARRLIATAAALLPAGAGRRLLDVGCGYGFYSREALLHGFDVQALELAANERWIAEQMTGLKPVASTFEAFECASASFSVVLMSQILEHAQDVEGWAAKAWDLLEDQGLLVVALPNFGSLFRRLLQEREPYICPPAHLNFFSAGSLSALLEKRGFRVEDVQWTSRVRRQAIARRLPGLLRPALPVVAAASAASMKLIDALGLGMMVTVYARKAGGGSGA